MKSLIITLFCACVGFCAAAEDSQPASHIDLTHIILDFLSRTELCLNSCQDAESVKAALPQLRELQQECGKIVEIQQELPEPTVQDYMAVQNQMEAFNTIWDAIRNHIERLEAAGLLSDEMRDILHIARPE